MRVPTNLEPLFRHWRDALAGLAPEPLPTPQLGFYRVTGAGLEPGRRQTLSGSGRQSHLDMFIRQKGWTPCAFWIEQILAEEPNEDGEPELADDERFLASVRGKCITGRYIQELWERCRMHPISHEAYEHALQYGEWADDPVRTPKSERDKPVIVTQVGSLF